jgi:hypothetical protein
MGDILSNSSAYTFIADNIIKLKIENKVSKSKIEQLSVVTILLILRGYV